MNFDNIPEPDKDGPVSDEAEQIIEAIRQVAHLGAEFEGIKFVKSKQTQTTQTIENQTEIRISETIFRILKLKRPSFNLDLEEDSQIIYYVLKDPIITNLRNHPTTTSLLSKKEISSIIESVVNRILGN